MRAIGTFNDTVRILRRSASLARPDHRNLVLEAALGLYGAR
jgi:hypothetical protein